MATCKKLVLSDYLIVLYHTFKTYYASNKRFIYTFTVIVFTLLHNIIRIFFEIFIPKLFKATSSRQDRSWFPSVDHLLCNDLLQNNNFAYK